MRNSRPWRIPAIAFVFVLLLFACVIDEDLRIHADGSGTYQVKVTIPKELGADFGELRTNAGKEGFTIIQEGQTETERFLIFRKPFTNVASLSDSNSRFELTITKAGWLRREYRLRASLRSVGFGSYKRQFVVTMPGKVTSSDRGDVTGSRVRWDATRGGSIEINATGYALPLPQAQQLLLLTALVAGVALWLVRRRRAAAPDSMCPTCQRPLIRGARFCAGCGAGTPMEQI